MESAKGNPGPDAVIRPLPLGEYVLKASANLSIAFTRRCCVQDHLPKAPPEARKPGNKSERAGKGAAR